METDITRRYHQRLARYTTAMRNEQPDRVPIRPFVAEVGRYAGYTCQELAHDYPRLTTPCSSARRFRLGRGGAEHDRHVDRHAAGDRT